MKIFKILKKNIYLMCYMYCNLLIEFVIVIRNFLEMRDGIIVF